MASDGLVWPPSQPLGRGRTASLPLLRTGSSRWPRVGYGVCREYKHATESVTESCTPAPVHHQQARTHLCGESLWAPPSPPTLWSPADTASPAPYRA
ncbi:hypothetical protein E2C01_054433 [Portunus trituberculatus]|uniref:Uncharacterized protein n=1 Tax=Portunus trituberculatus TaxID=210409 RepID=A0A5B7GS13_PORTR|nr:hypothetical protein [Portunus trituberculatus]